MFNQEYGISHFLKGIHSHILNLHSCGLSSTLGVVYAKYFVGFSRSRLDILEYKICKYLLKYLKFEAQVFEWISCGLCSLFMFNPSQSFTTHINTNTSPRVYPSINFFGLVFILRVKTAHACIYFSAYKMYTTDKTFRKQVSECVYLSVLRVE